MSNTHITQDQESENQGASLEDLGLEVIDNEDFPVTLSRPVRHILAQPVG